MKSGRSQRRLSNVKLTSHLHFRHMGLWIVITCSCLFAANLLLYLFIVQAWSALAQDFGGEMTMIPSPALLIAMLAEFVAFSAAIVYLAIFTSHRIAGPYIGIRSACEAIRDGDTERRIRFRRTDGLDDLEKAFNEMLDTLSRDDD